MPAVVAVKECSGDVRRITALLGSTDLEILVGGDDYGARGLRRRRPWLGAPAWPTSCPLECVQLMELVEHGRLPEARALNQRLLPLGAARHDALARPVLQGRDGCRRAHGRSVRAPRAPLTGDQQTILAQALDALALPVAA